ncbi:MAG: UbiA prenyltransferase family protein [Gaiellales bacterium]
MSAVEAPVSELPPRRHPLWAALVLLRPRQWPKNLLLFAGIVFAARIDDPARWGVAVAAFVAWCLASSAAYVLNDLHDVEADRRHSVKRRRPLARGELDGRAAATFAGGLALIAFLLVAPLGLRSLACLTGFLAIQLVYTFALKQVVLADAVTISLLFVLRAAAGAIAVSVRISPWLLVCTGLLALFLALGKRRAELAAGGGAREVLAGYDLGLVDQLLAIVAAATIGVYGVYTVAGHQSAALVATIPFVVVGLFRYLLLLRRTTRGEEPENVLVGDPTILASVVGWVVVSGGIVFATA